MRARSRVASSRVPMTLPGHIYELAPIDLLNEYPQFIYFDVSFALGVGYLLGVVSTFIVLSSTSAAVRDAREGPVVHTRVAALAWNTSRTK